MTELDILWYIDDMVISYFRKSYQKQIVNTTGGYRFLQPQIGIIISPSYAAICSTISIFN